MSPLTDIHFHTGPVRLYNYVILQNASLVLVLPGSCLWMQHFLPSMSFSAYLSELHPSLTKQIGHISSDKTTPYHALNQSLVLVLPSLVWYTTRIYHILIWSEAKLVYTNTLTAPATIAWQLWGWHWVYPSLPLCFFPSLGFMPSKLKLPMPLL